MARQISLFMLPEDERVFLLTVERYQLDVYPRRVPPDWQTFKASAKDQDRLPEEECYLAASSLGPVEVDRVKKGPDKGYLRVDETRSPVVFYQRSRLNENGELLAGQLWAELDVTGQTGPKEAAPDRFRRLFVELEEWVKKTFRKSDPPGFFVGPHAARRHKEGLVLRTVEAKSTVVSVWK